MPHHSSSGTEGIFSYCIYTVGETSVEDIHVARKDLLKEVRVGFCRRLAFPVISNFPLNSQSLGLFRRSVPTVELSAIQ
jgi:hypothetical protein